ncbi:hypothetical protein ACFQRL_14490 [Microbacterium fluvii]|uniref:ABC transporter permease n=1 Tax=Microbacterium fluvii TaxID=415215 RepID=A0ABW2HJZ4_9MICO|nr:hypothetical protein [Microbacterium fluvii]MCU4673800.1 hypothetical protein [Microbacterium fluvii]
MNRTLNVVRMQLVNRQTYIWVPLIIIGSAWVISYLIYAIIGAGLGAHPARGEGFNGASQAPLWYFLAIGVQALTLTFPFSQAMSVTRRTFFLGTTLVTAAAGAVLATLYTLLKLPELATNGWGVGSYMFALPWVTDGPWYHGWLFFFAVTVLFFILGFWFATIYKRFGVAALTSALVALALLLVGAVALITWQQWWGSVGAWLAQQSSGQIGAWMLAVAVVLGLSSYLTLRRATP